MTILKLNKIYQGDALNTLESFPDESINICVTSPPYWGLRDYGVDGQIGLEQTPDEYVFKLVKVFREVRRVLRDDGTLWLNIGDSYAWSGRGMNGDGSPGKRSEKQASNAGATIDMHDKQRDFSYDGLKRKDLVGIPWRVALALREDGWCLRSDIIWNKPNPMPESVTDRPTKAHEYLFLMSKSDKYYYDADAIREPVAASTVERLSQPTLSQQEGSTRVPGKTNGNMKAVGNTETRNRRSVWTVATRPYKGAHFATFPPALIEPCILAGCPKDGVVLDPFMGSGTTALVSKRLNCFYVGIELNPAYIEIAERRIRNEPETLFSHKEG